MKISLEEYVQASRVALSVEDAPMTALPGIKDAFVRLVEAVEGVRIPTPAEVIYAGSPEIMVVSAEQQEAAREFLAAVQAQVEPVEEKPAVRRGRPKKAETVTELPAAPEEQPKAGDKEPAGEPATTADVSSTEMNVASPVSETTAAEITDVDLNKFCGRLMQHLGDKERIYALAAPLVPEGAVARPTNIKDNAKRHEFVKAAEAATDGKVKYHG